jgi:hypothetical protein
MNAVAPETAAERDRLKALNAELLDALKRLESATRILPPDMDEPDSPLAQARAAIAKAAGGAA